MSAVLNGMDYGPCKMVSSHNNSQRVVLETLAQGNTWLVYQWEATSERCQDGLQEFDAIYRCIACDNIAQSSTSQFVTPQIRVRNGRLIDDPDGAPHACQPLDYTSVLTTRIGRRVSHEEMASRFFHNALTAQTVNSHFETAIGNAGELKDLSRDDAAESVDSALEAGHQSLQARLGEEDLSSQNQLEGSRSEALSSQQADVSPTDDVEVVNDSVDIDNLDVAQESNKSEQNEVSDFGSCHFVESFSGKRTILLTRNANRPGYAYTWAPPTTIRRDVTYYRCRECHKRGNRQQRHAIRVRENRMLDDPNKNHSREGISLIEIFMQVFATRIRCMLFSSANSEECQINIPAALRSWCEEEDLSQAETEEIIHRTLTRDGCRLLFNNDPGVAFHSKKKDSKMAEKRAEKHGAVVSTSDDFCHKQRQKKSANETAKDYGPCKLVHGQRSKALVLETKAGGDLMFVYHWIRCSPPGKLMTYYCSACHTERYRRRIERSSTARAFVLFKFKNGCAVGFERAMGD